MGITELIEEQVKEVTPYVIACRRKIHRFAELGNHEEKTSAFIEEELKKMGLSAERAAQFSPVAVLDTGKPGKRVGLRADIDALPMAESPDNLAGKRKCISDTPEKTCHACGHDAHAAMLLGGAKILCNLREELSGRFYFCFEQGEETGSGIGTQGILNWIKQQGGVDTFWAIHVYSALESGKMCVDPGPRMGGAAGADVVFTGRGGHGSRPDLSINPVFCAANVLPALAAVCANQIDANETVTLGITSIEGGGGSGNIIPDTASIKGSFRFFNAEEGEKAVEIFKRVCVDTADMFRCRADIGAKTRVLIGPVINDKECADLAREVIGGAMPEGTLSNAEKWYASESYARYLKLYPGIMCHLGIRNPEYGSGAEHHSSKFDVDENVLPTGVKATVLYAAGFATR